MRIVFRYDDFSASGAVSLETDRKVFGLFLENKIPLLVGATPWMAKAVHDAKNTIFHRLDQDGARIELLRQGLAEGWQLALHGFTHKRNRSRVSEFAGEPRSVQAGKIESGLRLLRHCFPGVPIQVFIPPWDSFDRTTVECLAKEDFRVICGSYDKRAWDDPAAAPVPAAEGGTERRVSFVPSFLETRGLVDYLRHYSIRDLERVAGDAWLVVTMHGYDFDGSRKRCHVPMRQMSETLKAIRNAGTAVGTIPVSEEPLLLDPKQESVLKGKVLLCRRKLVNSLLPLTGLAKNNRAITQLSDGIAALAWRLKTRAKVAH